MNHKSFQITSLILKYIVRIEKILTEIQFIKIPAKTKREFRRDNNIEIIRSASKLIDTDLGEYNSQKIVDGHVIPTKKSNLLIYANIRNVQELIHNHSSGEKLKNSNEIVKHFNKLLYQHILSIGEYGKFRKLSELPVDLFDSWFRLKSHYPNLKLESFAQESSSWLFEETKNYNELIKSFIFLFEFVDKSPLLCGNQLTAISLLQLNLYLKGYNPDANLNLYEVFYFLGSDLENSFKISKSENELTPFIEACLYSTLKQYISLKNDLLRIHDQTVVRKVNLGDVLSPRQLKILRFLETNKRISRDGARKLLGVSFMTAFRDLKNLMKEGYIEPKGVGRATYYELAQESLAPQDDKIIIEDFDLSLDDV